MSAWTDDDKITFGKYAGTKMIAVPASYLLWLWNNGMWKETRSNKNDPCRLYIIKNFEALEMDAPDVIVDHRP